MQREVTSLGTRLAGAASNRVVRRFRTVCKWLARAVLCFGGLVMLALLAAQVEQHLFRRRVERLAAELETLEMRKTPWQEAQARLAHWGASQTIDKECDDRSCSTQIVLTEHMFDFISQRNLFEKLDDYFRWRFGLSYAVGPFRRAEQSLLRVYMRLGGRPAQCKADVGMRDGIVWSKAIALWIETYARTIPGWDTENRAIQFAVLASAETVPGFEPQWSRIHSARLGLHPNYLIGRPSSCEVCVATWTKFTPYADPADVNRLMRMNFSCLTRWQPCVDHGEVMPEAWAQYLAEQPRAER